MIIAVDDKRDLIKDGADMVIRTYKEAIRMLPNLDVDELWLDHDLGGNKTGYDILCLIEAGKINRPRSIKLLTANPAGRAKMNQALESMGYEVSF